MELPFLLLLWELSDPRIVELRKMPQSPAVLECLGVDPLNMPRTTYQASEGERSQ